MWIIPKNLHTSRFVPDMEALTLDLNELSAMCEQSLFQRSKPSLARTWLQRWKRASWSPHLFGRILRHSHGDGFAERWISSLEASLVSPSLQRDTEPEPKTPATYSPSSSKELELQGLPLFSWKTSRGSCQLNSRGQDGGIEREPQFLSMSFESWNDWAIKQRRECSRRERSAAPIIGGECSSWRSPTASNSGAESELTDKSLTLDPQVYVTPWGEGETNITGSRREPHSGILINPRWVETLMGLPVGWTMPSCAGPVTTEEASFDFLETESSPIQQREPSASCGKTWPTPHVGFQDDCFESWLYRQIERSRSSKVLFDPSLHVYAHCPDASLNLLKDLDLSRETKDLILEIKQAMNK